MRTLGIFALAITATLSGKAMAQCSTFSNTPPGTNLALTDESGRTVGLGFDFMFNGVTYTTITVSSNGFVWLGAVLESASAPLPTAAALATGTAPRIAPLWWNLNPGSMAVPAGGGVFYTSDGATQANVVWKNVPQLGSTTLFANFEVILTSSGGIYFYYDTTNGVSTGVTVVGMSRGGAGNPANAQVFSTNYTTPASIANATGTQQFAAGAFDLNDANGVGLGSTMQFLPTDGPVNATFDNQGQANFATCTPGVNPTLATASTVVGTGCPTAVPNGSIYELFTIAVATNPIDLATTSMQFARSGDNYTLGAGPGFDSSYATTGTIELGAGDEVLLTYPLTMGVFPFGTVNLTSVVVSSNGYLGGPSLRQFFDASADRFHSIGVCVAGYWKDLVPNTTTAPLWVENNAGMFRMTWENVPLFAGAGLQTFQIQLNANGDIILSYGALTGSVNFDPPLAGVCGGGSVTNLGNFNLMTAGVPNAVTRQITGGFNPMVHTTTRASIGANFVMRATVPNQNLGVGIWSIGGSNPGIPLEFITGIGTAPGCSVYSDGAIDVDLFSLIPPGHSSFGKTIFVPYSVSLAGITIFTQAGAYTLLNPANIITSNGRTQVTGL